MPCTFQFDQHLINNTFLSLSFFMNTYFVYIGAWTGPVIKMLAPFWNTDVANDFLSANCPKLVCNDAADAIIADSSSLKSGIAEAMEMKRGYTSGVGMVKEPPLEYRMADFEDIGVQGSSL